MHDSTRVAREDDVRVVELGASANETVLEVRLAAVEAIDGFPFMLQLVGYRSWNSAGSSDVIGTEDVHRGIRLAREELGDRILRATLSELSKGDLAFLRAMAEDEGWHAAAARYQDFVCRHRDSQLLLLEIGVGGNTPVIIEYPFWQMAAENPRATYACVSLGEAMAPVEIAERSVLLDMGASEVIEALRKL